MPLFDLSLPELRAYCPARDEPADFDAFWSETLSQSRAKASEAAYTELETPLRTVSVSDVTFSGYMGQPVRGWLLLPNVGTRPLPAVIEYIGYGGGRAFPFNHLIWASAGYPWPGQRMEPRRHRGAREQGVAIQRPPGPRVLPTSRAIRIPEATRAQPPGLKSVTTRLEQAMNCGLHKLTIAP